MLEMSKIVCHFMLCKKLYFSYIYIYIFAKSSFQSCAKDHNVLTNDSVGESNESLNLQDRTGGI